MSDILMRLRFSVIEAYNARPGVFDIDTLSL
jgi:hypothetical protein